MGCSSKGMILLEPGTLMGEDPDEATDFKRFVKPKINEGQFPVDGQLPTAGNSFLEAAYYAYNLDHPSGFEASNIGSKNHSAAKLYKRFLSSGITYSNSNCKYWFKTLYAEQAKIAQTLGEFNIAGNAAGIGLGLANVTGAAVGALSGSLATINNLFKNYEANFLISPDILKLQIKVDSVREKLRIKILAEDYTSI